MSGGDVRGGGSGPLTAVTESPVPSAPLLLTGRDARELVAVQGAELQGGGGDVLSELQSGISSALGSVLQPTSFTSELSGVMGPTAAMTTDPESLRFQYPLDEPVTPKKKATPTVYREQDRFLPINNVSRVMRNAIPRNGKVSKDAKECMQECVSEFISFITSEAADRCLQEKRKTLTGDDILFAMATLGFDNYVEPMKLYLQKIREYMKVEKMGPVVSERVLQEAAAAGGGMAAPGMAAEEGSQLVLQPPPLPPSCSISPQFTPLS